MLVVAVGGAERLWCELANPAWLALTGRNSVLGAELADVLPSWLGTDFVAALQHCAATGGRVEVAGVNMVPQSDGGYVRRVVCTLQPERSRPPEDVRFTTAQVQTLLDHYADYVTRFDRRGHVLYVNQAVAELYGRHPQELVGARLHDPARPVTGPGPVPESVPRLVAALEEVFRTRAPGTVEVTCAGPRGSVVVHFRLVPGVDSSGEVADVLLIGRDISSVKLIEQELDRSRARYRDIFDNALDQMVLLEICPGGRYRLLEANLSMQRAMGRSHDELVGRYQDELFTEEADRTLTAAYRAAIDAGGPVESEFTVALASGTRTLQSTIVPARDESGRIVRIVSIVRDITERELAEQTLRRVNSALQTLSSGNMTLVRAADEPTLLSGMCQVMVQVGGFRRAWIGYPVTGGDFPVIPMAWASSDNEEASREQPDPVWLGPPALLRDAVSDGKPTLYRPDDEGSRWPTDEYPAHSIGIASCLSMPLLNNGDVVGVFVVHSDDPDAFGPDELRLLVELGADLAYGIHNVRARAEQDRHEERLLKAMNATIQALADTTELRDPYTAGHQRRVAQLAEAVGRRLELSEDRVAGLYLASTIHDIGKISVPAEILSRPGQLSDLELQLMQLHVAAAHELLRGIEFPWPVADIVAQHHERCDGSGYPAGLTAGDLLLESRILAVCDVVEAMSSHRPYRPGLGMEAALAEVQDGRGARYDTQVVDATVALLRSGRFRFT